MWIKSLTNGYCSHFWLRLSRSSVNGNLTRHSHVTMTNPFLQKEKAATFRFQEELAKESKVLQVKIKTQIIKGGF